MLKAIVNSPVRSGDQTINNGNLVIGTAGQGIDFSAASHAAGMTSELLNDYEEGTWTPVLTFATPGDLSVTYSTQVGRYTKVGRLVTIAGTVETSAFTHTTASGNLNITGLPFTAMTATGLQTNGQVSAQGWTKAGYTWLVPQISSNASSIYFQGSASGTSLANITVADCPSGTNQVWRFAATYFA